MGAGYSGYSAYSIYSNYSFYRNYSIKNHTTGNKNNEDNGKIHL